MEQQQRCFLKYNSIHRADFGLHKFGTNKNRFQMEIVLSGHIKLWLKFKDDLQFKDER